MSAAPKIIKSYRHKDATDEEKKAYWRMIRNGGIVAQYKESVEQFVKLFCVKDKGELVSAEDVYGGYVKWLGEQKDAQLPPHQRVVSRIVREMGFQRCRLWDNGPSAFRGLRWKD